MNIKNWYITGKPHQSVTYNLLLICYFKSGICISNWTIHKGNYLIKTWHKNGQLGSIGCCMHINVDSNCWDDDHTVEQDLIDKIGEWTYYDDNGNTIKTEIFPQKIIKYSK